LKLAEELDEGVGDELRTRKKSSQKTREKIVQIINNNPNVTTAELAELLELTTKGIEWQLKQLKEHNIIRRVGADKGGYWEIVK
jgi:ATP-dependent DNA helicase RecG